MGKQQDSQSNGRAVKWLLFSLLLMFCLLSSAQKQTLPIDSINPIHYHSLDSLVANAYLDHSMFEHQSRFSLITETKNGFSALIVNGESAEEFPLVKPNSSHRITLAEMESFDVNLDGIFDLIISLNHLQGHSLGKETFQEIIISKYILDTANSTLLLKDTTFVEGISTLLLGESPIPVERIFTSNSPIHVFEGKLLFMPCTGNNCETSASKKESEYLWIENRFILKEY